MAEYTAKMKELSEQPIVQSSSQMVVLFVLIPEYKAEFFLSQSL